MSKVTRIVDPLLTTVVRGYSNAAFISEAHFPIVQVDWEGFKVAQFGKDSFKLGNTERAIHAKSNRGQSTAPSTVNVVLTEHDWELAVDNREQSDAQYNVERARAITCMDVVMLGREKKAADILQNTSNYANSNKITLTGDDQFTTSTSDPLGVIDDGIEAIRQKIAKKPNVMTIGAGAWKVLKRHQQIVDKVKYSMKGVITLDLFKSMFDDFEDIRVGEAVYVDDDGTQNDIWSDSIILSYRAPAVGGLDRDQYTPSMGYTFRKKGHPYADTYVENGGKIKIVRSTDLYDLAMLGAEAAYLINDTNA